MSKKIDRTGEIKTNTNGTKMKIIKYYNTEKIVVEFEDGTIKECNYNNFKRGKVNSVYDKTYLNIGFIGDGNYKILKEDGKQTKAYVHWYSMLHRCYDENKYKTYSKCYVCEEWHNFQNFAKWFDENYYDFENEKMNLDKDILNKNNKTYSQQTCVFVPHFINMLFVKSNSRRGDYPIGVHYDKSRNKFVSESNKNDGSKRQKHLGRYNTVEEAFNSYKFYKEKLIKEIADLYKNKIPQNLYEAMYKWEVEITD